MVCPRRDRVVSHDERVDGMRKEKAEMGEEKSRLERELSEAKAQDLN